ncbi:MAG TPA: carboxypeptidase regulatory-like domain-containing protein [Verrucomicrobiae bacterium]|nr:carboxypeptidase regulatory-like domain-containing protein [Verrucomicrobiae bacterium]
MRLFKRVSVFVAGLLMVAGTACAQGVGASGDIKGTVTDPTGALLTNATVTATDVARGTKRSSASDNQGVYLITGLSPSTYSVSVEHAGFQTELQKGVVVNVGLSVTLDFHLQVSGSSTSLEVTTEPPVVDTAAVGQSEVIDSQSIENLPINRRDYLTFTLLAPGVTDSTRLASDQDFRVKQTPQSGLSFYGSNGRGNSVTVDGGEANDDSGGVRLTLSQDAVQEFQINRSNYGADLAGGSGASINIVSKSGTNDVHGGVYGLFRNDVFDARNPFAVTQALQPGQNFNPALLDSTASPTKDTLSRQQWGATLGFPIDKDKTFAFFSFENVRQDSQNSVPLLTNTSVFRPNGSQASIISGLANLPGNPTVPCISHTNPPAAPTPLPAATCAAFLSQFLTLNPNANFTPFLGPVQGPLQTARMAFVQNQFEGNGGLFSYNTREYFASGRLDHIFNPNNQVYLRYSFAHDNEQSPDVQSLTGFSAGSSIHAYDNTAQAAWFHQFSARTQNELRAQFNYTGFNVIPNQPGEVGLAIPGFANLGTNIFLPSLTIMRRPEIADNMSLVRGKHTIKFGGSFLYRGNHTESHTFFPGRFVFGNLPGGLLSPCLQVPAVCSLPAATTPAAINGLQSASLGLPQFYQQGFGNPIYSYPRPFTSFYWQDQWAIASNFTLTYGLRYELDAQYGQLNTDKDNFAPRASFAWDPFKNHKVAVRGGFGLYYSPIYGQIADVVQTLGLVNGVRPIAQVFVPLTGVPGGPPGLSSALIYQTLFAQGKVQCNTPAAGSAACITPADLTQFGINVTNTGPVPPLTVLFSGQPDYQSPYSMQGSFGIEGEVSKGFSVAVSGIYVHTLRLPVALDTNLLPTAPFTTATSPFTGQQVTFQNWAAPQCGANPFLCFANPLRLQTDQYSSKGSALYEGAILEVRKRFNKNFTLFGNYTFSKAYDTTTDFNSDFAPFNQLNLAAERGLSDFDQRHKVVAAAILDSPWSSALGRGWQLAPIFRYNSGHPFNILAAGTDINGDRHSTNDRPLGIGRNTGLGPDFYDTDVRVSKSFKLGEKGQLQFIAEGFNIFNRTNFGSVNNEVPTVNGFANIPAHPSGNFGGSLFGFTSALAKRQLQFGLRIGF